MMKFKKFLAAAMTGVMMFGMVATAAPAICVYAEGEEANSTRADLKVIIDYPSLTATIESTAGDKYVLLEVLKMKILTISYWLAFFILSASPRARIAHALLRFRKERSTVTLPSELRGSITLPKGTEVKVLYSADNSAAAPTAGENEAKFTFKVIGENQELPPES